MPSQPALQAASEGLIATPKNNKIDNKIYNQEYKASVSAEAHTHALQSLQKAVSPPPQAAPSAQEQQHTHLASTGSLGEQAPRQEPAAPPPAPVPPPHPPSVGQGKAMICLTEVTAIPPPEKPVVDEPWTPLTCLKLADYYRGETLPESERKESAYQKVVQAAISLVNKQGLTYQQVDAVLQYMKGVNETLKDDWWADKKVDLWHVADHGKAKLLEISQPSRSRSSSQPCTTHKLSKSPAISSG